MENSDYSFSEEFKASIVASCIRAREETLAAGVSIFYLDRSRNMEIMEQPDGRKFEIRYIPNAPGDQNYEVLRELDKTAA